MPTAFDVMETTDYQKQAVDFLEKHGVKIRISLSDTKTAPWDKGEHQGRREDRHHYRVTLSRQKREHEAYDPHKTIRPSLRLNRLTFDFWGSVNDFNEGREPTAYDVLACISGDANYPDKFEDFCSEMGMDTDSISALQTFRRCSSFAKRLRDFFSPEELEGLSEIQ